jgi:hypothetical protein
MFVTYALRLLVFYILIDATMFYSSRFGEDDASHKVIWAIVEYLLLLVLEGLGGDPAAPYSVYKLSLASLFVLFAFIFGRVAWNNERSRRFSLFWSLVYALSSFFVYGTCFEEGAEVALFTPIVVIYFLAQPIFFYGVLMKADRSLWDVPPNLSYIVHRGNNLYVEVLAVALIVPNAIYPGSYSHQYLVFACDVIATTMALSLKWALLDVEPVEIDTFENHAFGRGRWRAMLFSKLNPLIILGLGLAGGSLHILITGIGEDGLLSSTPYYQASLCTANVLFWVSLTLTKLLHKAWNPRVFRMKCTLQGMAAVASIFPFFLSEDFWVLVAIVVVNAATMVGIFSLNYCVDGEMAVEESVAAPRRIRQTKFRTVVHGLINRRGSSTLDPAEATVFP